MIKKEVQKRIEGLDDDTAKSVVCALVGHSRIQTMCFGYYNCGRCGDQVGDGLASYYDDSDVFIVGHDCTKCRENLEKLTWQDKWMAPNPLKQEVWAKSE